MSTLKVDGIRSNSATSDAITLADNGTCTANITNNLSNRRLTINGAMTVAQRATSSTTSGYGSVDRFLVGYDGVDESPTQAQVDVASGTTPYTNGFRKALRITNGNQSNNAGAGDYIYIRHTIEAQDIANSGWNYLSSSSDITLSFWVKSSVSQNFYCYLDAAASLYTYVFETGTLSANTWTKITKTIPGNSNLVFNNNNTAGLKLWINQYWGTNFTGSVTLNTWGSFNGSARVPAFPTNWYETNDATFELTGVQLEVGSVTTDFEHRSYGQELQLCKRYYQRSTDSSRGSNYSLSTGTWHSADGVHSFSKHNQYYDWSERFEIEMRAAPTLTIYGSSNQGDIHIEQIGIGSSQVDWNNNTTEVKTKGFMFRHIEDSYGTSGSGNGFGIMAYTVDAEL